MARQSRPDDTRSGRRPGRIAFAYALVSLAWIVGSGLIVQTFTGPLAGVVETAKGAAYVLIVTLGLYLILSRRAAAIRSVEAARAAADAERLRLASVVEQSSEPIVITEPDLRIRYVNPAMEHACGHAAAELIGTTPGQLLTDPDGEPVDTAIWPRAGHEAAWRGPLACFQKDGPRLEFQAVVGPILDAAGKATSFVGVLRDVTHERALERQLAEAGRMEAVGQLAGGIAHDFNNQLTAILGYGELLRMEVDEDSAARADADEILRAAKSAAALVSQLLALARRQVLAPTGLALDDLLARLRPMLVGLLGPRMTMEIRSPERLEPVFADPGSIEQVLVNLTVNARDAMSDGGRLTLDMANVTVERGNELGVHMAPGRYVRVTVTDTGSGMDQATLARVFEPFFTTKPAGKGTGLGLATTYGIVTQSGGYLFAESEPGVGSTFTVCLPRYEGSIEDRPMGDPTEPAPTGDETVQVIEDDAAVRALVVHTLGRLGYRVLASSNGQEALAQLAEDSHRLQLLVTDIRLPGPDGPAIATELKARYPGLRVLYVSGYGGDAMVRSGLLTEDAAFLQKPFTADELARRVRTLLDGHSES